MNFSAEICIRHLKPNIQVSCLKKLTTKVKGDNR